MAAMESPARTTVLVVDDERPLVHLVRSYLEREPFRVIDAWLSAAEGDPSDLWFTSVLSAQLFPELLVKGQHAFAAMLDAHAAREYFTDGPGDLSNLGVATTATGWGGGQLVDAWPATPDGNEYRRVRTSDVETLLIGGALDVSTPPQIATNELLPYLPNGHEVVLAGFGHRQPVHGTAGSRHRLINTFLASGRVDDSLYAPVDVDFTPSTTLGTDRDVHARCDARVRGFDRAVVGVDGAPRAEARQLRAGGRRVVALEVLRHPRPGGMDPRRPDRPDDNAWRHTRQRVLAVVAVCPPIALGIYLAWVHRDWTARSRAIDSRRQPQARTSADGSGSTQQPAC